MSEAKSLPVRQPISVRRSEFFMPFEPVIKVRANAALCFISGATALPLYHQHPHETDKLNPPEDVKAQTELVMGNIADCLKSAGLEFSDIVRMDCFLTNMAEQDQIGEVMSTYFQGTYPSATMVEVRALVDPRLKLEVNVIAASAEE